uniref:Uncharacterized protein n=1 Tax=Romanomermis culicivorax TaxID=13658 RepID=A0A915J911_ROMCU
MPSRFSLIDKAGDHQNHHCPCLSSRRPSPAIAPRAPFTCLLPLHRLPQQEQTTTWSSMANSLLRKSSERGTLSQMSKISKPCLRNVTLLKPALVN